jgi:hypothetical protein
MGIGVSVFLIALGAILAFAVNASVAGIDIQVIGWILMGAGLLGLILTLLIFAPRNRRTVVESHAVNVPAAPVASQPVAAQPVAGQPQVVAPAESQVRQEIRDNGV